MDNQLQHIQEMAFRYFEGSTTSEEAEALFSFLKSDANNHILFKSWENQWFASIGATHLLNAEWEKLKSKEQKTKEIHSFIPAKKPAKHYLLIVASVALLILGGFLAGIYLQKESPEDFFTTYTSYGEKSKIAMPDGSTIWLNSGSSLTYSDKYGIKNRQVELRGEAYFEVEKGKKDFIVQTPKHSVVVKGTKFNISAYPDNTILSTTLLEGRVELKYKNRSLNLTPGETVEVDTYTHTVKRIKTDTRATAWTQNRLEYDNIELDVLLKKLSREYDKTILLKNHSLKSQSFSISIDTKGELTEVLNAIGRIIPLKIINRNDTITVM